MICVHDFPLGEVSVNVGLMECVALWLQCSDAARKRQEKHLALLVQKLHFPSGSCRVLTQWRI